MRRKPQSPPPPPSLVQIERRLRRPGLFTEIRAALERAFGSRLKEVVLYGSQARGEARSASDVDVLVVLGEPCDPEQDEWAAIQATHDIQMTVGPEISIGVVREDVYRKAEWPLYHHAHREGISL